MVLGGLYCPTDEASKHNKDINDLKTEYGLNRRTEIKWNKISVSNVDLFLALVEYFFKNDGLSFRGYIARGKNELNLEDDHEYNEW